MNPRRPEHEQSLETARQQLTGEPAAEAEKPTLTPMQEATKLEAALAKLKEREAKALAKHVAKFETERAQLMANVSDKAKRILEAAEGE